MRPLCLLSLVAVVVAGCGGSGSSDSSKDFDGPKRVVAVAIEDLEQAGRDDEPRTICDELLAESLLQRLRQMGTDCRRAVSEALDDADQFDLEVKDIRLGGSRAQARVSAGGDGDKKTDVLRLERAGQDWKIASLGG